MRCSGECKHKHICRNCSERQTHFNAQPDESINRCLRKDCGEACLSCPINFCNERYFDLFGNRLNNPFRNRIIKNRAELAFVLNGKRYRIESNEVSAKKTV